MLTLLEQVLRCMTRLLLCSGLCQFSSGSVECMLTLFLLVEEIKSTVHHVSPFSGHDSVYQDTMAGLPVMKWECSDPHI